MADLICADGIFISYTIGKGVEEPFTVKGNLLLSPLIISAPILRIGSIILFIGRDERDSSPKKSTVMSQLEIKPINNLALVPEFPRYIGSSGCKYPPIPTPLTIKSPFSFRSISTPNLINALL